MWPISSKKVAQTINQSMRRINAKHMDVHVSAPFQNKKNGKSYWIVVFGDNGQMWLIKPEFVTGYLQCLLAEIETTNIDIGHCETIMRLTFVNKNLGQTVFGSVFRRKMEGHPKLPKDFLLCIHVIPLKKQLESKD